MNALRSLLLVAALAPTGETLSTRAGTPPPSFVSETEREFISTGDFDGDGHLDLVIVDRETGRVRVGYGDVQQDFQWHDYFESEIRDVSGVSIGRLFSRQRDAVAVASANCNAIAVLELGHGIEPERLVTLTPPGLGPNSVVALDVGGAGNTPLQDLFINTTYNTPNPNQATLFRDDAGKFTKIATVDLPGAVTHGNRVTFRPGQAEFLCFILTGDDSGTFRADSLASGKPQTVATIKGVAPGSDYLVGSFRNPNQRDLLLFTAGEKKITFYAVDADAATLKIGEPKSFEFEKPVKSLFAVPADGGDKLVATFGTNEIGGLFSFDGAKAPVQIQELKPNEGDLLSGAAVFPNGFLLLSSPAAGWIKYSTRYQQYALAGSIAPGVRRNLGWLFDTDRRTVPGIHKLILQNLTVTNEVEMRPYTNIIPGTTAKYSMVVIPGGEFTMGSPAGEKDRKADEGPQHKVRIEPFWMGQCEVTWGEYFAYVTRDSEYEFRDGVMIKRARSVEEQLADAVSGPTEKPYLYVGSEIVSRYLPAFAMTHHAANKYCHWLSAKTGHFYRLPTEAEWEYACRAGTTTAYFFGDDASELGDYAWFEDNSDITYQKIGKKKPNPWGLYDIYGNVTEWCLDQLDPGYYTQFDGKTVTEPWNKATKPYPHVVRGGSWDEPAAACRSAARRGSEPAWKQQDPRLPKSYWWLTDAQWVGFRIIRPLKVPPPEQLLKYWTSGTEKD